MVKKFSARKTKAKCFVRSQWEIGKQKGKREIKAKRREGKERDRKKETQGERDKERYF